jgi:NinG protein
LNAKKKHSLRGKKLRQNELVKLRNKAWKEMSIWVRKAGADWRGYVRCFTCPKFDFWNTFDSGHFKHGVMDFNPKNLQIQCTGCNRWWSGRLDVYATNLVKKYGSSILDELERGAAEARLKKDRLGYEYTKEELIKFYEKYKKLNARL